ncbi:restriction endonuclease subunit S [Helicobacter typhlonius]
MTNLQIPLPPLATQNQIVQILESKFTHLDNLAQFVNASLENL